MNRKAVQKLIGRPPCTGGPSRAIKAPQLGLTAPEEITAMGRAIADPQNEDVRAKADVAIRRAR